MINPLKINNSPFKIDKGPWTPAEITTLAWYDPSDSNTISEDDAAGFVSQLDDKSGNDNHLTSLQQVRQLIVAPLLILMEPIN
jgi:hypothetical protein